MNDFRNFDKQAAKVKKVQGDIVEFKLSINKDVNKLSTGDNLSFRGMNADEKLIGEIIDINLHKKTGTAKIFGTFYKKLSPTKVNVFLEVIKCLPEVNDLVEFTTNIIDKTVTTYLKNK